LSLPELYQSFYDGLIHTGPIEFIAVIAGIVSVWFSRKESIWVYPTGLVNTTLYVYLSIKSHLLGEASVNFYYTIMSIYGWWLWSRKDELSGTPVLSITHNSRKDWQQQLLFVTGAYCLLLAALIWTNLASIPLYFVKGFMFTSVQFLVLLILAIAGLISWQQKAAQSSTASSSL